MTPNSLAFRLVAGAADGSLPSTRARTSPIEQEQTTGGQGSVSDRGLTHIAFRVSDLDRSVAFYADYAAMNVVHRRNERGGARVAWVTSWDC